MDSIRHGTASGYVTHRCRCDICKAYKKANDRAYYLRNQEKIKALSAAVYHADPQGVQARRRELEAAAPEVAKERRRQRAKEWAARPENRARQYVRAKKYAQSEKGKIAHRKARAKRKGTPYTTEALEYIKILLNDPCSYCGGPGGEIDHIVPVNAGGTGEVDNLTAACRSCNGRKWEFDLLSHLLRSAA